MRLFFVKDFLDLVFPRNCELCGKALFDFESNLCVPCKGTLPVTNYHLRPWDNDLKQKVEGLTRVRMVVSFLRFSKSGKSQKLLHSVKYKGKPKVAEELGMIYGTMLKDKLFADVDYIVPVPLHLMKEKRRGYNQSEKFAQGLSANLEIPVRQLLERVKFTDTQTEKTRLERLENVQGVFKVKNAEKVRNSRIILVDDVMTTGATLCSCANELLGAGAKSVDFLTIAAGN